MYVSRVISRTRSHLAESVALPALLVVTALAMPMSAHAQAPVTIDGTTETVPSPAHPSQWTGITTLTVGSYGTGTLEIKAGGTVSNSSFAYIGKYAGSEGTVLVSGVNSEWINSAPLFVGQDGKGELKIEDGGKVQNTYSVVGRSLGSSGVMTVSGENSEWINSSWLQVGTSGEGTLIIKNGGKVQNTYVDVARYRDSSGRITVSGEGSQWISSGVLAVGYLGDGFLTIEEGGTVRSYSSHIGFQNGSSGLVVVRGKDSQWINDGARWVGDGFLAVASGDGTTATLSILDGGRVENKGGSVGYGTDSKGSVTVSGKGSQWINLEALSVGQKGNGVLNLSDGGVIQAPSVTVAWTTSGVGTINIGAAQGSAAAAPGTLTTPTVQLGTAGSLVFNHTDTSGDYVFAAAISGTGTVDVFSGETAMTGVSDYSGLTTVYGNATLVAGAASVFSPNSDYVVHFAGALDLRGNNQTVAGLTNAGLINIGTGTPPGTILTVTGNYTGNNGMLVLNTFLGDDSSPSDRLVVGDGAAGQTFVTIVNVGGQGAQTTGNGILIIETGSSESDETFRLSGRVAAGAYEYSLVHNANASSDNWYLTSEFVPPSPEPSPEPSPTPSPNYRVEFPLMASVMPIATDYGYAMLGTLHERVGEVWNAPSMPVYEERTVRDNTGKMQVVRVPVTQKDQTRLVSSGWARLIGDRGFKDNGNFERHGPDYNYTFSGIQAGVDVYGREQADGTLDKAGFYAGYGAIDANVKGAWSGKAGSIDMDAYTVGAYWTHKASQGWYTDAVLQGTWYSAEAKSVEGQKLKPDGFGIIASLEGGYGFALGNGLTVEPQAQLAYQTVSFDDVSDAYGRFRLSDQESLRGRLGVRVTKNWALSEEATPRLLSTWVRVNAWHEFMGDATATAVALTGANPVAITSSLGGTWGEIGAGVSGQVTDAVSLFATGSYSRSLDNKGREAWNGRLGATFKW